MNSQEKLRTYFKQYVFMQNIHFCRQILNIKQNTIKSFVNCVNKELRQETFNRIYPIIEKIVNIIKNN